MSITVQTQHMENYGSEEGTNYWKFKWGSVYVVKGTDHRPANAVALVTHYIAKFNSNTDYAMEFVTDWYVVQEEDEVEKARLSDREEFYNYNALDNAPTVLQYQRYLNNVVQTDLHDVPGSQLQALVDEHGHECGCSNCTCHEIH